MNPSSSPVVNAEQRAWDYWFADGLTNLVLGIGNLLAAFTMTNQPHWPPTVLSMTVWIITFALWMVIILRLRDIVEWLKEKMTYPRTGYVRPTFLDETNPADLVKLSLGERSRWPSEAKQADEGRRKRAMITLVFVVIGVFTMILVKNPWACTAGGLILGAGMWVIRHNHRLSWLVVLGFPVIGFCISMFVGAVTYGPIRMTYFLGGWGILFVLDGAITLIRYLVSNPLPKAEA